MGRASAAEVRSNVIIVKGRPFRFQRFPFIVKSPLMPLVPHPLYRGQSRPVNPGCIPGQTGLASPKVPFENLARDVELPAFRQSSNVYVRLTYPSIYHGVW